MEIFDSTMSNLENAVSRAAKIQEVIAHNIANANTPGYVPMKFDDVLQKAVQRTDRKNVNLEEEMADMAKNNIDNSGYIKLMMSKLSILRTIVTQGRK